MTREPSISEVIGRMIMVGIRGPGIDDPRTREDVDACKAVHAGGVILFDVDMPECSRLMASGMSKQTSKERAPRNFLTPEQVTLFTGDLRSALGRSLLIGVDQEGGAVSRLNPLLSAMGQAEFLPASLLQHVRLGEAVSRMSGAVRSLGFNVNFAPCVDVAINPVNPIVVTNGRCFSSDPLVVVDGARQWLTASARNDLTACLKHFPGHGSSAGDTHSGFVDITRTFRPDVELLPYRELLSDPDITVPMVMTGHLFDASIDADHPASLSFNHTTRLLREQLGFKGVVVTDSLDMGAITQRYSVEDACILAINAGADILLDANNSPGPRRPCPAPVMHKAVMQALARSKITGGEDRLRASWRRIESMRSALRGNEPRT